MIQDILIPLVAVGLAELGDKTQLAVLCLASKTKEPLKLLIGVILGFAVADGIAIVLGSILTNLMPINYIKIIAGIIFLAFGILILLNKEKTEEECNLKKPFASGFLLILLSEFGDKTQIASGLFATEFNPVLVFTGVMTALIILSVMAIYLGKILVEKTNKKTISIIAGTIFIIIGIATLLGLL